MTSEKDDLKRRRDLLIDQITEATASGDRERRLDLYGDLEDVLVRLSVMTDDSPTM